MVVQAHLATQRTQGTGGVQERRRIKRALLRGLYERGLERAQILELFRLIDWLLALPPVENRAVWQEMIAYGQEREMPFIMDIEKEAIERGLQQGLEQGLQRGLQQGLEQGIEKGRAEGEVQGRAEGEAQERRRLLQRLLTAKGGALPEALTAQIEAADPETLNTLLDRVIDGATATELLADL